MAGMNRREFVGAAAAIVATPLVAQPLPQTPLTGTPLTQTPLKKSGLPQGASVPVAIRVFLDRDETIDLPLNILRWQYFQICWDGPWEALYVGDVEFEAKRELDVLGASYLWSDGRKSKVGLSMQHHHLIAGDVFHLKLNIRCAPS